MQLRSFFDSLLDVPRFFCTFGRYILHIGVMNILCIVDCFKIVHLSIGIYSTPYICNSMRLIGVHNPTRVRVFYFYFYYFIISFFHSGFLNFPFWIFQFFNFSQNFPLFLFCPSVPFFSPTFDLPTLRISAFYFILIFYLQFLF